MEDEIVMIRKSNLKRVEREFWIDTYGKIHRFKGDLDSEYVSFHYEIVEEIFPEKSNPEKHVEDLGWIKIGSRVYGGAVMEKEPNQDQINKLMDLGLLEKLHINREGYYIKFLSRD